MRTSRLSRPKTGRSWQAGLLLAATSALLLVPSPSFAAPNPEPTTPSTQHVVNCSFSPKTPYKLSGGAIRGEVVIGCNASPESSTTALRVWRFDRARVAFYMHAESVFYDTGTYRVHRTSAGCSSANILYDFHTEVVNESYHHNWGVTNKNSAGAALRC